MKNIIMDWLELVDGKFVSANENIDEVTQENVLQGLGMSEYKQLLNEEKLFKKVKVFDEEMYIEIKIIEEVWYEQIL